MIRSPGIRVGVRAVAAGARATSAAVLNRPNPIYSKSLTLYCRQPAQGAMRHGSRSWSKAISTGCPGLSRPGSGGGGVVRDALTPAQAQQFVGSQPGRAQLRPGAAGQGATAKSCEMLVAEGFEVNVAILPSGEDPDTYVRKHGPNGYGERLRTSRPYLEFLLDRAAAGHNLNTDEGRVKFLSEMLPIAGRIPDLTVATALPTASRTRRA